MMKNEVATYLLTLVIAVAFIVYLLVCELDGNVEEHNHSVSSMQIEESKDKIITETVSDSGSEVKTDEAIPTSGSYILKVENSLSVEESNERAVVEEKELKVVDVPVAEIETEVVNETDINNESVNEESTVASEKNNETEVSDISNEEAPVVLEEVEDVKTSDEVKTN